MTNPLLILADRVEGLSGPDRDVDDDIATCLGWRLVENPTHAGGLTGRWYRPDGSMTGHEGFPAYTASLDAAMTLVPKGWTFAKLSESDSRGWWCELRRGHLTSYDKVAFGKQLENTSAAIAVTAACLRARTIAANQERQPS